MTGKIDPKSWEGHTPGPWEAGENPRGSFSNEIVVRPRGQFPHGGWIADCGCRYDDQTRANAALIAAAPDLAARVAELEAALQTNDFDLVAAAVLLQQRTAERDEALTALRLALPLLERDHRSLIECGSHLRVTDDGTIEPIPGTLDEDCVEDARAYEAAIDAARAALKGDPA